MKSEVKKWNTELKEISPGIYAYVQATGGWFINNTGLIVGEKDAIVVDSLTNARMAESFLNEIKKVTDKPFSYLINTHHHQDHTWTNHMFHAKTICQTRCREETMKGMMISPPLMSKFSRYVIPGLDITGAKVTLQDITFDKEYTIHQEIEGGMREIRLVYSGPAHTVGDIFVHLPKERVVFCGDLLFAEPCTPLALMGTISGYIQALDLLANLDVDVYVPGHGPISDKEAVYKTREYLVLLQEEARKQFNKGVSVFDAAQNIDLGEYENWTEKEERLLMNVMRAYSDFRGTPPGMDMRGMLEAIMGLRPRNLPAAIKIMMRFRKLEV